MADSTIFADCGGPFDLTPSHPITCYESQPTSGAELAIMTLLRLQPWRVMQKRMLHVGIGNSEVPAEFGPTLGEYVGITISDPELSFFREKFPDVKNVKGIILNKYDYRMYDKLDGDFDIIVDTLLKSYACCEKHFIGMMDFFAAKLIAGGALVTTDSGVRWGWKGNTNRCHTPGAQIDPEAGEFRILGRDNLGRLCGRLGLKLEEIPASELGLTMDDSVLVLSKVGIA